MLEVPVARFAKRLARYRRAAHRSPIAVSEHGQTTEELEAPLAADLGPPEA